MSEAVRRFQTRMNANGFPAGGVDGVTGPATRRACLQFQRAWAGGLIRGHPRLLARDGIPGPYTLAAASFLPRLSPNFKTSEFRCKHARGLPHCGNACYIARELIIALEALRARYGGPVRVASGYRCPVHNRNVGGASRSVHTYVAPSLGAAADILDQRWMVKQIQAVGVFSGIGYKGSNGRVTHVDVRAAFGLRPAVWRYSS